ncbi:Transmembrane protein [Ceratobasidium theobromae]|uniref:Transmembrane protein n=1 Tax=Ceratobasidium theobromae TaxID=1582974 RepID=A0A5N5QM70_9AGAM|nr:Transmembrane protein [Ceratobasidium theobromae]
MTLSVITVTSVAALAIPPPFSETKAYWFSFACYTAAFGLSLEGLILLGYLSVLVAGSSNETVGRAAHGKSFLNGLIGPLAFILSFPTVLTTYSSLFLLVGLMSMAVVKGRGECIEKHEAAFNAIALTPICFTLVCIAAAIICGEIYTMKEAKERARNNRHPPSVSESRDTKEGTQTPDPEAGSSMEA